MSVYRPAKSPYFHYDFTWQGRRYHGSTGCKSRREALAFEARKRNEATLPSEGRDPITLDMAAGLYEETAGTKPSWRTVEYMIAALIKGMGGNRLLSEIGQRDLQTYYAKRRNGRSNASVNREQDVARAIWKKAEEAEFDIGKMPAWKKLRYAVPSKAPRELSWDEEDRLFAELRVDVADAVAFALKSGWRRDEVRLLRWADVDFSTRQAVTRIKGGDEVKRPLTPALVAIIANQPKAGPFVFTYVCKKNRQKRKAGERYPLSVTVLRQAFNAAKREAEVGRFRFHDLRHTRGTRIVRSTGSLAAAKAALAHKSINTTLRYAHVLDEDVRNALDVSDSRTITGLAENAPCQTSQKMAENKGKSRG